MLQNMFSEVLLFPRIGTDYAEETLPNPPKGGNSNIARHSCTPVLLISLPQITQITQRASRYALAGGVAEC